MKVTFEYFPKTKEGVEGSSICVGGVNCHPFNWVILSNNRHKDFRPSLCPPSLSGVDWRALVDDQRPENSIFLATKNIFKIFNYFWKKSDFLRYFLDFSRFLFSGLGWTGELWSNRILLILRNKEDFFFAEIFFFFRYFIFFEKKKCFLGLVEIFGFQ